MTKFLTLTWLFVLTGCVTQRPRTYELIPKPLPPQIRATLGKIAVISADTSPVFESRRPLSKASAMGVGLQGALAAGGAAGGGTFDVLESTGDPYSLLGQGAIALAVTATAGTLAAAGGTAGGLIIGVSPGKAKAVESTLRKVLAEEDIQRDLREQVVKALRRGTYPGFLVAEGPFREPPVFNRRQNSRTAGKEGERPTRFWPEDNDTLLDVRIEQINVAALTAPRAPLMLVVPARVLLLRAKDRSLLYTGSVEYRGSAPRLTDWSVKDGQRFRAELRRCNEALAEKIAVHIFGLPPR